MLYSKIRHVRNLSIFSSIRHLGQNMTVINLQLFHPDLSSLTVWRSHDEARKFHGKQIHKPMEYTFWIFSFLPCKIDFQASVEILPWVPEAFMRGFRFRSCLKKWPARKAAPLVSSADKTKLPVRRREKTSGTQCIEIHDSKAYLYLNFSVISSKLTNVEILSKY